MDSTFSSTMLITNLGERIICLESLSPFPFPHLTQPSGLCLICQQMSRSELKFKFTFKCLWSQQVVASLQFWVGLCVLEFFVDLFYVSKDVHRIGQFFCVQSDLQRVVCITNGHELGWEDHLDTRQENNQDPHTSSLHEI